jgi:hypothetical protein
MRVRRCARVFGAFRAPTRARATHERDLRRRAHREDEARARLDDEQALVDGRAVVAELDDADRARGHCGREGGRWGRVR